MIKLCTAGFMCIALVGCAERTTPEMLCGGESTKELVKSIVRENWLSADDQASVPPSVFESSMRVEMAAPSKFDAELKRAECSANLSVSAATAPGAALDATMAALDLSGSDFTGAGEQRRYSFNVSYVAQDVEGRLLVQLEGASSFKVRVMTALLRSSAAASPAATASSPAETAVAVDHPAPVGVEASEPSRNYGTWEGVFSNGTVTIERSSGARGRDEFTSSACPNFSLPERSLTAKPGEPEMAPYEVQSALDGSSLTITGSNQCMPAGTYARVR
jgi:hypothetical protein